MKQLVVFVMGKLLDYSEEDLDGCSDGEFKALCREGESAGRVYNLEDFSEAFNSGEVDTNLDYIRILEI